MARMSFWIKPKRQCRAWSPKTSLQSPMPPHARLDLLPAPRSACWSNHRLANFTNFAHLPAAASPAASLSPRLSACSATQQPWPCWSAPAS